MKHYKVFIKPFGAIKAPSTLHAVLVQCAEGYWLNYAMNRIYKEQYQCRWIAYLDNPYDVGRSLSYLMDASDLQECTRLDVLVITGTTVNQLEEQYNANIQRLKEIRRSAQIGTITDKDTNKELIECMEELYDKLAK